MVDARLSDLAELFQIAELYRVGGARFGARRLQIVFEPVVTESAFPGPAIVLPTVDYAKGAVNHAVAAAVADIGLHIDAIELGADNSACGAAFQAAGARAVFTDIRREQP